jgi:hypothetical protein
MTIPAGTSDGALFTGGLIIISEEDIAKPIGGVFEAGVETVIPPMVATDG